MGWNALATMPRPIPFLFRWIEPLIGSLPALFGVWTALVATVWLFGLGEVELAARVSNPDLLAALQWLLRALDPLWITLGAVNVYLALVASDGLPTARRWMGMTLLVAGVMAGLSSVTEWPLGPVHYTTRFGAKIGPVPFALPLLAVVLLFGARETVLRAWPRAGHHLTACTTGIAVGLAQWIIDPIAWRSRAWWLWIPADLHALAAPPLRNFLTWTLAAGLLAWVMREERVAANTARRPLRPVLVFASLLAVILATHLAQWLRR